jgi:hypothetical protein
MMTTPPGNESHHMTYVVSWGPAIGAAFFSLAGLATTGSQSVVGASVSPNRWGGRSLLGGHHVPVDRRLRRSAAAPRSSSLRQSRFAQPVKTVLYVLGVLVAENSLVAFNRETGVDPQHLRCLVPGVLKVSRLGIGAREQKMPHLHVGQARCAFAGNYSPLCGGMTRVWRVVLFQAS